MNHRTIIIMLITLAMGCFPVIGFSAILTFDGNICNGGGPCGNNLPIDQSYGDIAGELDVIWDAGLASGGQTEFSFFGDDYSNLTNIGYGLNGQTAEIFLDPLPGWEVTLVGFDLGAWPQVSRISQVTVLTGGGSTLFTTGPNFVVLGVTGSAFNLGLTSGDGIRIQFGPDAFNVGIDNIEFTTAQVSAVPVPAAVWLFGTALVGLLGFRRRQTP